MKTLKVLKTNHEPSVTGRDFLGGKYPLYPEGTRRLAITRSLFYRTMGEERRRGVQIVEQEAGIEVAADSSGAWADYNSWRNVRYVDPTSLEYQFDEKDNQAGVRDTETIQ